MQTNTPSRRRTRARSTASNWSSSSPSWIDFVLWLNLNVRAPFLAKHRLRLSYLHLFSSPYSGNVTKVFKFLNLSKSRLHTQRWKSKRKFFGRSPLVQTWHWTIGNVWASSCLLVLFAWALDFLGIAGKSNHRKAGDQASVAPKCKVMAGPRIAIFSIGSQLKRDKSPLNIMVIDPGTWIRIAREIGMSFSERLLTPRNVSHAWRRDELLLR